LLFLGSVAADDPERYLLWVMGLATQVAGLLTAFYRWTPPPSQSGDAVVPTTPSLIERMGLFVIIVLGEVIVSAVNGMADITSLDNEGIIIGLLGVLVAIGLWWIYFDLVSHRTPISGRTQLWINLHLPLVIAMAAGGAGVLNTVEHAAEPLPDSVRWLLVASLATAVLSVALLTKTLEERRAHRELYRAAIGVMLGSVLLSLGVGLTNWGAKASLTAMVVLLLAPVAAGMVAWLRNTDPNTVKFS
jgi:low temperature requirement protein LtrA